MPGGGIPILEVLLTSDQPDKTWHYHVGVVTELFEQVALDPARTVVLMCGPEIMMRLGVPILMNAGAGGCDLRVLGTAYGMRHRPVRALPNGTVLPV